MHTPRHTRKNSSFSTQDEHLGLLGLEALTETPNLHYATRSTYFALLSDGKAFVEFVLAFILSLGFQLTHKSTCNGGSGLTRHAHYARVRLGGLSICACSARAAKQS